MTLRYIRWDYDKGEAVEFERQGQCNGCGACCQSVIRFTVCGTHGFNTDDLNNGGDTTSGKGVWTELVFENDMRRFWRIFEIDTVNLHPCSALLEGNRCAFHNHANNLCTEWPLAPEHVTPFPECSFTFKEVNRWPIEITLEKTEVTTE